MAPSLPWTMSVCFKALHEAAEGLLPAPGARVWLYMVVARSRTRMLVPTTVVLQSSVSRAQADLEVTNAALG